MKAMDKLLTMFTARYRQEKKRRKESRKEGKTTRKEKKEAAREKRIRQLYKPEKGKHNGREQKRKKGRSTKAPGRGEKRKLSSKFALQSL